MAKPLWQHVEALTAKVFAHHGFAQGEILARWAEIAGPELATCSRPDRIRWPRRTTSAAASGEKQARQPVRKEGGVLILKVAPGHALTLQHETPHIIGRINSFYGYEAVTKIKVVQDPSLLAIHSGSGSLPQPQADKAPALRSDAVRKVDESVAHIPDARLREALRRLGRGVLQRQHDGATKP